MNKSRNEEEEEADENYQPSDEEIIDKPLQIRTKNILEDENSLLISDRKEIASYVDDKPYEIFDKAKKNLIRLKNDLDELDQYNMNRNVIHHDE